MQMMLLLVLKL